MKVIIEGSLIDLEKIYKITEVVDEDGFYSFKIKFINKIEEEIYLSKHSSIYISRESIIEDMKRSKEEKSKIELETKDKVVQLRDKLVKLWLENQTDIPVLKFEE